MSAVAEEKRSANAVAPFGVEANTTRNQNVLIQCIPGCVLRGRLMANRSVKDQSKANLGEIVPRDQAEGLSTLAMVPGMEIHVNPAKRLVEIVDPLTRPENKGLLRRIEQHLSSRHGYVYGDKNRIEGHPKRTEELDEDRTKTLCRELLRMCDAEMVTVVKGRMPTIEEIDELPGEYLLEPAFGTPTSRPRYEYQLEAWWKKIGEMGG